MTSKKKTPSKPAVRKAPSGKTPAKKAAAKKRRRFSRPASLNPERPWFERRLKQFDCRLCGRRSARSFETKVARLGLCRKCRKSHVDPRQSKLPLL